MQTRLVYLEQETRGIDPRDPRLKTSTRIRIAAIAAPWGRGSVPPEQHIKQ